jgi:beta-glucanase (GH16 family)
MNKILLVFLPVLLVTGCAKKNSADSAVTTAPLINIKSVELSRNSPSVITFPFYITLNKASSKEVKVDYATADGTANANDYTQKLGTLIIPANQTSAEIDIVVKNDSLRGTDKVFYLKLSNPLNAKLNVTQATGTIICDGTYLPVSDSGYNAPTSYAGLALAWNDEFNSPTLNSTIWNYDTGAGGWGNNELENYTSAIKNSYITDGGYLVIEARKELDGTFTSARLQTKGNKQFTHGRMDIRARLPKTKGIWPAIWMLGSNISTSPWPACGEIDIMELLGNEPNKVYGTMHWGQPNQGSIHIGDSYVLPSGDFSNKFHVFSIVWDSSKIEWYVDNVKYFTGNKTDVTGNYPFDKPFFFLLNVAIGGNWPGAPDASTVFPQRMIVDYIRVYQ